MKAFERQKTQDYADVISLVPIGVGNGIFHPKRVDSWIHDARRESNFYA